MRQGVRITLAATAIGLLVGGVAYQFWTSGNEAERLNLPRALWTSEREAIEAALKRKLIDPRSAIFEHQPLKNIVIYCGHVNAKNRMGGYAGRKRFMVLLSMTDGPLRITKSFIGPATADSCAVAGYP